MKIELLSKHFSVPKKYQRLYVLRTDKGYLRIAEVHDSFIASRSPLALIIVYKLFKLGMNILCLPKSVKINGSNYKLFII